jgi:hypothetical protein
VAAQRSGLEVAYSIASDCMPGAVNDEAAFSSTALSGDPLQRSTALVIWYQDGWAQRIETPVLSHLSSVDWASIALDEDL